MTPSYDHCIPQHLRKISEKLLESKGAWSSIPEFSIPFLYWLVIDGCHQLVEDIGWEFAVEPYTQNFGWRDSEISEYIDDTPKDKVVDDELRLECAKFLIDSSINELDDWMCVHAYPLPTAESPQGYLCATSEVWGQAGAHYWFHGVFSSKGDVLQYLRDWGLWLLSDVEGLNDEDILQYWNYDHTESEPKVEKPPKVDLADSYYWRDSLFFDLASISRPTLKLVE